MAADLTDDQIEQLLSAAEVSLANKPAVTAAVAGKPKQQQNVAVMAKAPTTAEATVDKAGKDAVKPSKELELRVPKLKVNVKKVRTLFFFVTPFALLHDETKSQICMTRRRAPVLGADPAHKMIFYLFIVTLTGPSYPFCIDRPHCSVHFWVADEKINRMLLTTPVPAGTTCRAQRLRIPRSSASSNCCGCAVS